jgi:hypothetical protein
MLDRAEVMAFSNGPHADGPARRRAWSKAVLLVLSPATPFII